MDKYKLWGEITYPFPNFSGASAEVLEWMSNFILHFTSLECNKGLFIHWIIIDIEINTNNGRR